MSPTEEIAIKLGLKTGDLKSALADAGVSIKKLKKDGEDSSKGFLKSFSEMKHGFREIKEVIMGAGIVEGFLKLNEAAQKFAENWKGGYDADVAATLRLKEAQQDLGSVVTNFVGRAGVTLVGLMEKAGIAAGALVYGVDAASDALNKMDEENKKAFDDAKAKKLREETEKLAKVIRDNTVDQAEGNQKINILAGEFVKLLQEQAKLQKGSIEYVQKSIEVEKSRGELAKADADQRKKEAEEQKKLAEEKVRTEKEYQDERARNWAKLGELYEKENDMNRESLTLGEQQKDLLREEAKLVAELSGLEKGTVEYNEAFNRLLEVRGKLYKTEEEAGKKNIEIAKLLLVPEGERTDLQKEQLKLLMGETTEHKQALELQTLLIKGVENLTEAEKKRLQVLMGQTAEIKVQGDEAERQRKAFDAWSSKSITNKGDVRTLDDTQLNQLIQNLNKQLDPIKQADYAYGNVGMPPGSYKSVEQYMLQQNLDQAIAEQSTRRQFQQTTSFFGNDYSKRTYAPDEFARLSQLFNPDQMKKDSNNIATLATGMQAMFPDKFGGAIR